MAGKLLEAALEYAARGWKVFPLAPGTKDKPLLKAWQEQATDNPESIEAWWSTWPNANVGIATGPSGLVVIDVDPKHDGDLSLQALQRKHDVLETWNVRTPSGGLHYYYQAPGNGVVVPIDHHGKLLGKGIDVQAGNTYVLAPPSTRPEGAYVACSMEVPAYGLPGWLEGLLLAKPAAQAAGASGAPAYRAAEWGEGARNSGLTSLAGRMRKDGLSEAALLAALQQENAGRCRPPLTEADVERIARSVGRYEQGTVEALTDYQQQVAAVEAELEELLGDSARAQAAPWTSGSSLLEEEFPPAEWLVRGVLAKDTVTIIGADPKASKTWTLLEIAHALSTGTKAFGEFFVPAKASVLLFLNEDSRRSIRNRLRALCAGHQTEPSELWRIGIRARESLDLCDRRQLAQLIVDIRMSPERPAFVGLDPLRNIHTAEENSSTEMKPVLAAIGAIRKLCGCAVVANHHSAKNGGQGDTRTAGARMRGSSSIDGFRDGLISLEETKKNDEGTEISNKIVVDLKAYKAAGRFSLTLKIEDDAQGEAVRAQWVYSKRQDKAAGPGAEGEELKIERVEWIEKRIIMALKHREMGTGDLAETIKVRRGAISNSCAFLVNDGMIQCVKKKWSIVPFRSASVPGVSGT